MVTLILAFIFITPQFWNYGDKPASTDRQADASGKGLEVTVNASEIDISGGLAVKNVLTERVSQVLGSRFAIDNYTPIVDSAGKLIAYRIQIHRVVF
jgi:hypothetical protein